MNEDFYIVIGVLIVFLLVLIICILIYTGEQAQKLYNEAKNTVDTVKAVVTEFIPNLEENIADAKAKIRQKAEQLKPKIQAAANEFFNDLPQIIDSGGNYVDRNLQNFTSNLQTVYPPTSTPVYM